MKKNRLIILITLVLAIIAAILVLSRSNNTFTKEHSDFAVDDTATITRIFMADKTSHSIELVRGDSGIWMANNEYRARPDAIQTLLKTMLNMAVMQPVSKNARNTIIKRLAASAVKVEIYQQVYRIDLFRTIRLFPHEKRTRVYYVGSSTPDNMGTYMIMENAEIPFITYLPGFRGFIAVRFSPRMEDWRDHTIFATPIAAIQNVTVEFVEVPGFSYEIRRAGERAFTLVDKFTGKEIPDYDTARVLEVLIAFSNIKFEALVTGFTRQKLDSISGSKPFHIITLTDTKGNIQVVRTFHRSNPEGILDEAGNYIPFDRDRMYALINDGKDLVLIQFFVFDAIIKPITALLKEEPGR